jgi:homoserine dehydrogenase
VTRALGVGLLGLGTVGSAVARAMGERTKRLDAAAGRSIRLVGACARDATKERDAGGVVVTTDAFALLDDPEVDVIVEVVGGTEPARDLHLAAFERGKHVVTANKELVAKEWRQLHEAARMAKRELRYEAAVAAAVPVVAAARSLGAARPRVVSGLLNGTTTYICSRMEEGGTFDAALAEAQAKGYAEADPSADVDGWDPAYKLSILVSLLEGRWFDPELVRRASLRSVTPAQISDAAARGNRVRYLAVADFGERATKARVGVEEVPASSLEGQATGPTNVVRLDTDLTGPLAFVGAGAGGDATASAILSDVIQVARAMR